MANETSLRHTFDEVALLYNEVRPRYPPELFSTLIDIARLDKDSTLLEIGPGTGQATKPLAQKGFQITAVELGDSLAMVAPRSQCDSHPGGSICAFPLDAESCGCSRPLTVNPLGRLVRLIRIE